jgi:hypothetical protein
MSTRNEENQECCPRFEPQLWEDKLFEWDNKKFVKDSVKTFFFMPLNFGQVMRRMDARSRASGATVPDWLCLSDHTSNWNMDLYLAVDKDVDGAKNTTISGKFYSRVYEGPFRDTRKWTDDYKIRIKEKGFTAKKMYMWYTTCPKCAKKYGKNYVVILSEINQS